MITAFLQVHGNMKALIYRIHYEPIEHCYILDDMPSVIPCSSIDSVAGERLYRSEVMKKNTDGSSRYLNNSVRTVPSLNFLWELFCINQGMDKPENDTPSEGQS